MTEEEKTALRKIAVTTKRIVEQMPLSLPIDFSNKARQRPSPVRLIPC
jgi:hypothetical protein